MYACGHMWAMVCGSEDKLQELVLFFHHMGPMNQTQAPFTRSHLVNPFHPILYRNNHSNHYVLTPTLTSRNVLYICCL